MSESNEQTHGAQAAGQPQEDQEEEEAGWPGWLSWLLVIAASVFGGYLLAGYRTGGAGDNSAQLLNMQRQMEAMAAQYKAQFMVGLETSQRLHDERMRSFCREMILQGLFQEGVNKGLADLSGKLGEVAGLMGDTQRKPEDRLVQAGTKIKEIRDGIASITDQHTKNREAVEKVSGFGSADQKLMGLQKKLGYLYYDRAKQLMKEVAAGNAEVLRQAVACRTILSQIDEGQAAELDKAYPQLAATTRPAQAPAGSPVPAVSPK